MTPSGHRSSWPRIPREPMSRDQLEAKKAAAWHGQGLVCVRPEELPDDWVRVAVQSYAITRWGKRNAG
jgi:hypothetical protein